MPMQPNEECLIRNCDCDCEITGEFEMARFSSEKDQGSTSAQRLLEAWMEVVADNVWGIGESGNYPG